MSTTRSYVVSLLSAQALFFSACLATDPPSTVEENNTTNNMVNNANNTNNTNNENNDNNLNNNPDPNNQLPVAAPGLSRQVTVMEEVILDGSGSYDPDGDKLLFSWVLVGPDGSAASLNDASAAITRFTPDVVGDYTATLVVNDGKANSAAAAVRITAKAVQQPNTPPVADAGINRSAVVGSAVMLDGSASSDADGDPLTYKWDIPTKPPGSSATITGDTSAKPSLSLDAEGIYLVRLIVSDGKVSGTPATVTITATAAPPVNQAPTARAGADRTVEAGTVVNLDGASSADPDGDNLSYRWMLTSPNGSSSMLSSAANAQTQFTPDIAGTYRASLVVNDGELDSNPAVVTITATKNNVAPVASAGNDQFVGVGSTITLDGSGSRDADGDNLSYRWSLTPPAGSSASLTSATAIKPSFVADRQGSYTITLVVNDGQVDSAPATIVITADSACLRISEYIEGSSNNKAFEVHNCGANPVDLSNFILCLVSNTNTTCNSTATFPIVLQANQVYAICNSSTSPMPAACTGATGTTSGLASFNGDDRLVIYEDRNRDGKVDATDPVMDAFGEILVRPGTTIWADKTYRRCSSAAYLGASAFDVLSYYQDAMMVDDFTNLGVAPNPTGCP